ncbi:MAG TPA: alanine racemase [Candidatus Cybelea sp.]|jgi:alanine racemase|nr:alanine racemase [Candidatus Cybelea sp.]
MSSPRRRERFAGGSFYERAGTLIGRLEISLDALRHNATLLRDLVGAERAAFVVKGNAYGHGLVPVARAIEPFAARLCVYTIEEALALRAGGIAAPLLVLGPIPPQALDDALAASLEVVLWSTGEFAHRLAANARKRDGSVAVHVKVNTDLNRLGFEPHEVAEALDTLGRLPEIEVAGIFSHLASAEELDSPYTMFQLAAFDRAIEQATPVIERMASPPMRHIAASAAAMLWPQTRLDLVRYGIALYGLMPSQQTREALGASAPELRPALSYRSQIVVTRIIPAGASVGYGRTFHAPREMRIGVVPAGYADGVPRALSNRGSFVVDGALCPIVGRVAMNMTEIDLTAAPSARVGSAVTLIGTDRDAVVSADDWAAWSDTINYEIVTRLPSELRREYTGIATT